MVVHWFTNQHSKMRSRIKYDNHVFTIADEGSVLRKAFPQPLDFNSKLGTCGIRKFSWTTYIYVVILTNDKICSKTATVTDRKMEIGPCYVNTNTNRDKVLVTLLQQNFNRRHYWQGRNTTAFTLLQGRK